MKQTEISDRCLVRLLPATYHKPPSLRGLVDSDDEMEILAEIEGLTSGRLLAERGHDTPQGFNPGECHGRQLNRQMMVRPGRGIPVMPSEHHARGCLNDGPPVAGI